MRRAPLAIVPDGPSAPPADDSDGHRLTAHRAVSIVATVGLFQPLLEAWREIVAVPAAGLAVVALTGAVLWMMAALAVARDERELSRLDRWLLVLGLLVLAAWAGFKLYESGATGTDEAALLQGAALRLLHGRDPYGANLTSSLFAYGVPPAFWTYTTSGAFVTTLGYPALPVLLTAPFAALLGAGQAVPMADLAVLGVATVAMFAMLPRGLRALALVVCVCLPTLPSFAFAGLTGVLLMATLLPVAYRWPAIGRSGRIARADLASAIALGLACSTNQEAWFIVPFVLAGAYRSRCPGLGPRSAARVVGRFAAIVAATFLVVNLPFAVWGAEGWFYSVLAPLRQHSLPYGQGAIDLSVFARLGGGAVAYYSYAAALLYLALLVAYVTGFPRLRRCCFAVPLVPLWLSGRSLASYWMVMMAVIVVSALAPQRDDGGPPVPAGPARRRLKVPRRPALASLFLPAAVCLGIALATPAPLAISVLAARGDPTVDRVRELSLLVHNGGGTALRPHFATNAFGQAGAFWSIERGPATLAAGATATYVLKIGDVGSMPSNSQPFIVQAVTDQPVTISSSRPFTHAGPVSEDGT